MNPGDELIQQAESGTFASRTQTDVNSLAPLATIYTKQTNLGGMADQWSNSTASSGSNLDKFFNYIGETGSEIGNLAVGAVKGVASAVIDTVTAPFKLGYDAYESATLLGKTVTSANQLSSIADKESQLVSAWKAGRITKNDYLKGINDLSKQRNQYTNDFTQANQLIGQTQTNMAKDAVNTGLDVIAVVSAACTDGLSTVGEAAWADSADALGASNMIRFFGQDVAVGDKLYAAATKIDTISQDVINVANKALTWNGKFTSGAIADIAQSTIADAADNLSAKQLMKSVAVNLLIKKPLIYQTNLDVATDIYNDIAKKDVGGASWNIALTASMAMTGGPLGFVMERAGDALNWLKDASYVGGDVAKMLNTLKDASTIEDVREATRDIDISEANKVGKGSFIDALSTMFGTGKASQIYEELTRRVADGDVASYKLMKVMAATNMKMAGGDPYLAAKLVADYYNSLDDGKFLKGATASDVIDGMIKYAKNRQAVVEDAIAHGMSEADAQRIVVGRCTQSDLSMIADLMKASDEHLGGTSINYADMDNNNRIVNARLSVLQGAIDRYGRLSVWANSDTLINQIKTIVQQKLDIDEATKAIRSIKTGHLYEGELSSEVRDQLMRDGYVAITPKVTKTPYFSTKSTELPSLETRSAGARVEGVSKEITDQAKGNTFTNGVKPIPVLQHVSSFLTKVGLSPIAADGLVQETFRNNFSDNLSSSLAKSGVEIASSIGESGKTDSQQVLSNLYSYIRSYNSQNGLGIRMPITDLRQLTRNEVRSALNCGSKEAAATMRAINDSMLQIKLATRGLGDKLQDLNIAATGGAGGIAALYSRTQGTLKFAWNPFFKMQQAWQTEGLAQMAAGGKILQLPGLNMVNRVLFGEQTAEMDRVIGLLEDNRVFTPGFTGVGSSTSAELQGLLGSKITSAEKTSMAGLVCLEAKRAGATVDDYIQNNLPSVVDTLKAITGTSERGSYFNSPLAKTLNMAFFPSRYNFQTVATMAKFISKMPATTQVAIIAGFLNAKDWLGSDEGTAWQQQYANTFQLFQYLSPLYPLDYVMKLGQDIKNPQNFTVGDLGQLGGLPFGFVSQLLESEGIVHEGAAINYKTGEVYPSYVPTSDKGQVNLCVQDLLGSLFTYPGATVGLPSKTSITKGLTSWVVGSQSFKANSNEQYLTPDQQHQMRVLQEHVPSTSSSSNSQNSIVNSNDITNNPQYQVRGGETYNAAPRPTNTKSSSSKKKIYARPIQTQI